MLHLLLLRHAKSDWGQPELDDFDRPLNPRGRTAARLIATYMQHEGLRPDLILCSAAQRARETLARLLPTMSHRYRVEILGDLYDEMNADYAALIMELGGTAGSLLLIGHNPATEQTARLLIGSGAPDMIADIEAKYPTAALTEITFAEPAWQGIRPRTGHLERFVKPRELSLGCGFDDDD